MNERINATLILKNPLFWVIALVIFLLFIGGMFGALYLSKNTNVFVKDIGKLNFYKVKINDNEYTLPVKLSEMQEDGWILNTKSLYGSSKLQPNTLYKYINDRKDVLTLSNSQGKDIIINLFNDTDKEIDLSDGKISKMWINCSLTTHNETYADCLTTYETSFEEAKKALEKNEIQAAYDEDDSSASFRIDNSEFWVNCRFKGQNSKDKKKLYSYWIELNLKHLNLTEK